MIAFVLQGLTALVGAVLLGGLVFLLVGSLVEAVLPDRRLERAVDAMEEDRDALKRDVEAHLAEVRGVWKYGAAGLGRGIALVGEGRRGSGMATKNEVSFEVTAGERKVIGSIAARAVQAYGHLGIDRMTMELDITATHANGCPLDLEGLLDADQVNFAHDIGGIRNHINRETGQLEDCFVPRYARREAAEAVSRG